MWFGVVSIFPEMFQAIRNYGITKRAISLNIVKFNTYNPRDYRENHKSNIDDKPYGGGAGMVMKVEPLLSAIKAAKREGESFNHKIKVVLLSPQGKKIIQNDLIDTIKVYDGIIFVCGRYEGVDERICTLAIDQEWSLGDFVMTGGELAAMAFIDAMIRLIPGSLGSYDSVCNDSFGKDRLLDYPHYTRPKVIYELAVPDVLLSGNHAKIANWRQEQRLIRTMERRKDLLLGGENET